VRSILWRRLDGSGLERAVLQPTADGHRIAGTVLLVVADAPCEIRYTVLTDHAWRVRTVGAHVQGPDGDRRLALTGDGNGSWVVGDAAVPELTGAIDVDLAWTPATATPAIRRLDLEVGESAEAVTALIDYPAPDIRRLTGRYTRLDPNRYLRETDDSATELHVDDDGIVTGVPQVWETAAAW
jgi:hypothetical protein